MVTLLALKGRPKSNLSKEVEASARIVRGIALAYIVEHGGVMDEIRYHLGKPNTLDELLQLMLKDFNTVLKFMKTFHKMRYESYTGKTQVFSGFRKYHEEWNLGLKALNAIFRPIAPRYSSNNLSGFLLRGNYENDRFENKQLWGESPPQNNGSHESKQGLRSV